MTDKEYDAIRTREKAALRGPWELSPSGTWINIRLKTGDLMRIGGGFEPCDANFVAHARTDIPVLLGEVDLLKKQLENRICWIPCSERLPEKDQLALVYDSIMDEAECGPIAIQQGWCCYSPKTKITHWMPLPEPPSKE